MQLSNRKLEYYSARIKPQASTEDHSKEIGINFQKARKKEGLTQGNVIAILQYKGVPHWSDVRKLSSIENGERKCSIGDMVTLCQLYECYLDEILPKDAYEVISALHASDPSVLKVLSRTMNTIAQRTERYA